MAASAGLACKRVSQRAVGNALCVEMSKAIMHAAMRLCARSDTEASLTKLRLCENFHAVVQGLSSMPLADDGRRVQTVKYECGPNGGPRQALRDPAHTF